MGAAKLAAESLDKLLHLLSGDETAASLAYEKLRSDLHRYFRLKGDAMPDEAADETLDRVIRKIEEGVKIEDAAKYTFGIARFVFLERLRLEKKIADAARTFHENSHSSNDDSEAQIRLKRECFRTLSTDDQKLLIDYFTERKHDALIEHRQQMPDKNGGTQNQLRLKIFRLKNRLKECVRLRSGK